MKLIINGDDYGLSIGVSKGIIKSIKEGVLTDTTAMTNMPHFEESAKYAIEQGITEMGVHLTLTCGKPLLSPDKVPTIVNENGEFYRRIYNVPENYSLKEIEMELRAQIEKFLASGLKMNHLDGHHHFYGFKKDVFDIVVKLSKEYNVPMRCPVEEYRDYVISQGVNCPEYIALDFYDENISEEFLISKIDSLKDKYDVIEIMAHPAIVDEDLINTTSYNVVREKELDVLTSEKVKNYINENNVELVSFKALVN